ncbi:hypothetical protein H0E87_030821 [Populus deltoides]|uniref:Uncharacterized protein n=1 Tax=Populus deltoides TaxID=3696 RepID=A0A8T2WLY8_POPDE|nr:hypothetical protein H0E87_030821 [Populus deltoides]
MKKDSVGNEPETLPNLTFWLLGEKLSHFMNLARLVLLESATSHQRSLEILQGYVIILSSCLWMTKPKAAGAFVEKMHVFPSKDKISPGMMEMVLKLPCGVKSAALILEFALSLSFMGVVCCNRWWNLKMERLTMGIC